MSTQERLILGFAPLAAGMLGGAIGFLLFDSGEAVAFGAAIALLLTFPLSLELQARTEPPEQRGSRAWRLATGIGVPIFLLSPLLGLLANDFPLTWQAGFAVVGLSLWFAGIKFGQRDQGAGNDT